MIMFALFSLFWFVPSLSANVFIGSSLLPRAGSQFALGYSNDVIKLYGSFQTTKQFMSFNVSAQTFTDHGPLYLSTFINGGGQFYAQLANVLYVINPNTASQATQYIAYFDLTNDAFTPSSISIPIKVFANSCIGAHTNFLAIVGGGLSTSLSALYLYDWIGQQWSQPADLTTGRRYHSCIVHHESSRFYVLGGIDAFDGPSSSSLPLNIETYHKTNPSVFTPLTSQLLNPVWGARMVVYGDDIYVVGGLSAIDVDDVDPFAMRIQIIDTVQQTVRYGPSLAYGIRGAPVVILNHILYCFGGWGNNAMDTWQYLNLVPTVNPTENPTVHPTVTPSNNPSINPTNNPSLNPTMNPSINPTVNPSLYPTTHPTINPTNAPVRDGQVHEVTTTLQDNGSPEDAIERDKELRTIAYLIFISIPAVLCIVLCGIYVLYPRRKIHDEMAGNIVVIQCIGHNKGGECVISDNSECDKQSEEYGVKGVIGIDEKNRSAATTGFDAMNFVNAAEMDQVVLGDDDVNTCGNTEK